MEISRATSQDAAELTEMALAAKRHWGYPERWMELWRKELTITPQLAAEGEVWVAEEDGAKLGFYALSPSGRELEHLWVRPERLGEGVGRALFFHALSRAAELGAETLLIESDPNAEGFYVRMGAAKIGERVAELDGRERVLPLLAAKTRH
ncbi:N-acetyltransferase [Rubrobacter xylanophilus]|uniref:N-acetyltransferase n=1 Tax=Rubrobacter xylanophilus TaxID=49319 RepID=A0A510HKM6_9ACTN|nr:GNAT family N-acetyltransferase [Rubrobacter xylanophilus]BBL80569.1 N-acetyltransferase [Rubrobacter xylanophilus]